MRGRVVAALVAAGAIALLGVQAARADTATVSATEDTYTSQGNPATAHGGNASLKVNAAPGERRAYVKFTVSGIPDGATAVGTVLRLWATTASSSTFTVWSVPATWSQSTLTWNNQPPLGTTVGSRTGLVAGQYNDFALSGHVTGNGTWALAITKSSTTQTSFASREAAGNTPPQLVASWTPPTTTTTSSTTTTTSSTTTTTSGTTTTTVPPAGDPKVAAAGDIACAPPAVRTSSSCHHQATANLLAAGNYDAVVPVGDLQYECGQPSAYTAVYHPSWGQHKARTRPVHGDHEYTGPGGCTTPGSSGYYSYFDGAASPNQPDCTSACQGYYSYELGTWHVVVLNTDCSQPGVGGSCGSTSPQGRWLAADLAAHPSQCTLAFWHLPRWNYPGSLSGSSSYFATALYNAGAEVVVSGNNHFYARFAPQTPGGAANPNGIRQFIVGTGGKSLHGFSGPPEPDVEVSQNTTYGILELTLHPGSYSWRFVPEAGRTFTDTGTNTCH
jgi:acid phosphatase type 7